MRDIDLEAKLVPPFNELWRKIKREVRSAFLMGMAIGLTFGFLLGQLGAA